MPALEDDPNWRTRGTIMTENYAARLSLAKSKHRKEQEMSIQFCMINKHALS